MPSNLRATILNLVSSANYQPVKPAVIAKKLGLAGDAARDVKKVIKQLVKSGELSWGPSHLVFATQKQSGHKRDGEVASTRLPSSRAQAEGSSPT